MIIGRIHNGKVPLYRIEKIARQSSGDPSKRLRIVATPAHIPMAEKVTQMLGVPLFPVEYIRQANGLWEAKLLDSIGGADLFIIHTANTGTLNENMMQLHALLVAISKLPENQRPAKVVVGCLHFPYARQERKAEPREPISAAAMANLIASVYYPITSGVTSGMLIRVDEKRVVDRIIVVNLHSAAIEGFFPFPVDHLDAKPLMINFIKQQVKDLNDVIITGPDAGRFKMALKIAEELFGEEAREHLINVAKMRGRKDSTGKTKVESAIVGNVRNKIVFVIDDMIDTGGTMVEAVKALKKAGAKNVYVVTVHGILSGTAIDRLVAASDIEKIGMVDTLDLQPDKITPLRERISILHFSRLLRTVIERTFKEESIKGYQSFT